MKIRSRLLLSGVLLVAACQTSHEFATPDTSWKTRIGQLKYTSGKRVLVGEVVVSQRGASDFQMEFQKGGGLLLLKLRMDSTTTSAEGILSLSAWRGWIGLREAFAKQQPDRFTVTSPNSEDRFDFVFSR